MTRAAYILGGAGAIILKKGLARARYDSRDGYGHHMKEAQYRRLDRSNTLRRIVRSVR